MFNVPNLLTLLRIALIPLIVLTYCLPFTWAQWATVVIFLIASITDWFDGYLARRLNQASLFGAFLDPVADKLMIGILLVFMATDYHSALFAIPASVIIGREITVSALREWMAELGKRASVAVSYIGKIKTTMQIVALAVLLVTRLDPVWWMVLVGYVALYVAAILTLWSMLLYLKAAMPHFKN